MLHKILLRSFNVGLRGVTLLLKFVLLFSLAKLLEPVEVGLYGLLYATIIYGAGVAGLGFWKYGTREVAAADLEIRTTLIRDQIVFYLLAYILVLPLCMLLFVSDALPWAVLGWFFALLVLEHVGTELGRILIATSQQVSATMCLFFRNGAWVLAIIPLMWFESDYRSLEWVFVAWASGSTIACVIGLYKLADIGQWDLRRAVNWHWLKTGILVATPLLIGTLAMKGLTTFDRYWVKSIAGVEILAAYVLFAGIANVVKSFLDSGVFVFSYPKLIRYAAKGKHEHYKRGLRSMLIQATVVVAGVIAISVALIGPVLDWINRPVYHEYRELFNWLLLSITLYAFGMVAHFGIYAYKLDWTIIGAQVAGLAVFMIAASYLAPMYGATGVPMALCVAYTTILLIKLTGFFHLPVETSH